MTKKHNPPADGAVSPSASPRSASPHETGGANPSLQVQYELGRSRLATPQPGAGEGRASLLGRATSDAVRDWDLVSQTMWWNERFEVLFGHDRATLPEGPESWLNFIHPGDSDRVLQTLYAAMDDGAEVWTAEYRFRRSDGRYAWVTDRGLYVRDPAGRAVRMLGSMTDVSAQRQLQDRLRQSEALTAIGQLTAGVAHDFNNLLSVIIGNAVLLEQSLKTDVKLATPARLIREAAERSADLTGGLLALARRQASAPRSVDVGRLVSGMEDFLRRTLGSSIEIEVRTPPFACPAMADAPLLENALLNLCINARDAMPSGGRLTIEVALVDLDAAADGNRPEPTAGRFVRLTVADTGVGMDEATLAQAFDPFFTTKPAGKGSGLGLSTVHRFATQSRGHVEISSEHGAGTVVRIHIPALEHRVPGAPETTARAPVLRRSGGAPS